ncbi:hypothetical protein DDB_G0277333 [Dictyostelium discoideum AX4]|uniref:Methyltransferase type 12 domain-containing protein n=1 Tax=Dictyostelium discoideum TaxID=44689 RepID=Q54ZX6_DICDI|nr:hypothetical protein DDB_G0277333 [Dictyostelium discoideum AX4]EAL68853.1 hypothetical protein DDB_G0277333 [Dictyostelium discoideum AX4]|eukprot:XP_642740.1 hypothetical protein DDB_G0277333 [Dictyostelium discoideum AX4]
MSSTLKQQLEEQQQYYNERATQYDDWWHFSGSFDQGEQVKAEALKNREGFYNFFSKITENAGTEKLNVLECASGMFIFIFNYLGSCIYIFFFFFFIIIIYQGTGNFTKLFLNEKYKLHCEEGSLQMIDVLKSKFEKEIKEMGDNFSINQTDLFSEKFNPAPNTYDIVFMGFLISHIPPSLFNEFFSKCTTALKPNGRLVFIDSYYHKSYKLKVHESGKNNIKLDENLKDDDYIIKRKLLDGKEFSIYKICFTAESIMNTLTDVGLLMQNNDSVIINSTYIFGSYSKPGSSN